MARFLPSPDRPQTVPAPSPTNKPSSAGAFWGPCTNICKQEDAVNQDLSQKLLACRAAWAVESAAGPACWWPRLVPDPRLAQFCRDRMGMGVPAECLPPALSAFSVCGWNPVFRDGRVCLDAGTAETSNGDGCLKSLAAREASVAQALHAWMKLQAVLSEMESAVPGGVAAMQEAATAVKTEQKGFRRRAWTPRVARRTSS